MCQSEKRYGGHGSGRLCGIFHLYNPTFCNTRHSSFSQIVQPLLTFSDISSCFLLVLFQEMFFVQSYKVNLGKLKVVFFSRESTVVFFFLLPKYNFVCVLSHVQFFGTPWTVALQAPLSMEFSRQEYWEWVAISFCREPS